MSQASDDRYPARRKVPPSDEACYDGCLNMQGRCISERDLSLHYQHGPSHQTIHPEPDVSKLGRALAWLTECALQLPVRVRVVGGERDRQSLGWQAGTL